MGYRTFQLLQNALRHKAKLLYCVFDLMFPRMGRSLQRASRLLEHKDRLKIILPRHNLLAVQPASKDLRDEVFDEAERKGLEGIIAKRCRQHLRVRHPQRLTG